MNFRAIIYYVGMVLKLEGAFLLFPLFISLYYGEGQSVKAILITAAITVGIGLTADLILRAKREERGVYVRDGFVLTAICWIAISVFGALPYYLSGAVPSFADCLFESVSGFTTTGSTVLPVVEEMPRGLLFWRSLTQWIGGMGVLVFLLAVASGAGGEHSVHVLKAESPGPSPGKLVPRLRQSAKILYTIYLVLTIAQVILLLIGGMPLFDSVCYAMGTAGTGGFSITNASIAAYDSVYIDAVILIFMILFGVNFNIYYFLLIRNWTGIRRSSELKVYVGVLVAATALIAWNLTGSAYEGFGQALRHASFQVGSIMTTTALVTADYTLWPQFSKTILLMLMVVGACAGSTAGGLKVSRAVILIKEAKRMLTRRAHPRAVGIVSLDGKAVDKQIVHGVNVYAITLAGILAVSILLVSLDNLDFETTASAVVASAGNVGPGFGMASPSGDYAVFSPLSKLVLMVNMLIGRLEIYPILLLFAPRTWRKL